MRFPFHSKMAELESPLTTSSKGSSRYLGKLSAVRINHIFVIVSCLVLCRQLGNVKAAMLKNILIEDAPAIAAPPSLKSTSGFNALGQAAKSSYAHERVGNPESTILLSHGFEKEAQDSTPAPRANKWRSLLGQLNSYSKLPSFREGRVICNDEASREDLEHALKTIPNSKKIHFRGMPRSNIFSRRTNNKLINFLAQRKNQGGVEEINNIQFPYQIVFIYLYTKKCVNIEDGAKSKGVVPMALSCLAKIHHDAPDNSYIMRTAEAAFNCIKTEHADILKKEKEVDLETSGMEIKDYLWLYNPETW